MAKDRIMYGHLFVWNEELRAWESTSGNRVCVLPPDNNNPDWRIAVEHLEQTLRFTGENTEERAFCLAELYTRQTGVRSSRMTYEEWERQFRK